MTTVIRASGSSEFLSMIPALAGFTPTRSLVLVPFTASRSGGAMRLDLPDDEVELEEYVDTAIGLTARVEGTDAVAVVVYTDEEAQATPDGLVLPFAVEVDELLCCALDAGLRIVDALCVTPSGWASFLDDEPELDSLPTTGPARSVGDVSGDQFVGTSLPPIDLAEKERVGRALRDISDLLSHEKRGGLTGSENPQAIAAVVLLEDLPAFFESVLAAPDSLPPFATAALLWCLDRPIFRDVAITQWATDLVGGIRTLDAQLSYSAVGATVPDDLGDVFLGRGPSPDIDRLTAALAVVRAAAARAPRASRPAPLTAAAWLSWALGRSTHAAHYLDLVREIDPRYGLASLLDTMIGAAVLPEWAFRRGSLSAT